MMMGHPHHGMQGMCCSPDMGKGTCEKMQKDSLMKCCTKSAGADSCKMLHSKSQLPVKSK
jgi:hypothetical protein